MKRILSFAILGMIMGLLLGIIPQSQAQSGYTWTADFYNNTNLSGTAIRQTFNNLSFNWGTGSPVTGINADNWSARFSTVANFTAGTYRFTLNADDAVRLYVHGQLYIDTWNAPRVGQNVTADVTLANGGAGIIVDFRENTGNAYVSLNWAAVSSNPNPIPTGTWVAEYWHNRTLTGNPVAVFNEASPNHDWGTNAPTNGVGADNWSARWSTQQYFNGGTYRVSINGDDGLRVTINGVRVIDEWHSAIATTYTRDVNLFTGTNTIVIEFYEDGGIARINFSIVPATSPQPQPQNPAVPQVTINTSMLNVRSAPFVGDNIINKVPRGATYIVVGRNADSSWWQIQIGAQVGWVSATYVIPANTQNVPVTNQPQPQPQNPVVAQVTINSAMLNVRSAPFVGDNIINKVPRGATYIVVGRNADSSWWQIQIGAQVGWVSGNYVIAANTQNVPVVNVVVEAPNAPSTGTGYFLRAMANLNIRSGAGTTYSRINILPNNAQAEILGRNSSNTWWLVSYGGTRGWVSGSFVSLPVGIDLNRIPVR